MRIELQLSDPEAAALEQFTADFDFATPNDAVKAALCAWLRGHRYWELPSQDEDGQERQIV
jgi:hypothetical protein